LRSFRVLLNRTNYSRIIASPEEAALAQLLSACVVKERGAGRRQCLLRTN